MNLFHEFCAGFVKCFNFCRKIRRLWHPPLSPGAKAARSQPGFNVGTWLLPTPCQFRHFVTASTTFKPTSL